MRRAFPFPNSVRFVERFVERSNAGNTIVVSFLSRYFLFSSGFELLVKFDFGLLEAYCLSAVMSFSVRLTFMKALVTCCFTVEWSVSPVLMYFRNRCWLCDGWEFYWRSSRCKGIVVSTWCYDRRISERKWLVSNVIHDGRKNDGI